MTVEAAPGQVVELTLVAGAANTGRVGLVGITIIDVPTATIYLAHTTGGIVEDVAGSGVYTWTGPAPSFQGTYQVIWDTGGSNPQFTEEDLIVLYTVSSLEVVTPGPCSPWITGADVQACCADSGVTASGASAMDAAAYEAAAVLYELSGRQFKGVCSKTIRPCAQGCGCWPGLSSGYSWGYWGGWGWGYADCERPCGCGYLNEVELFDYPVSSITQVKVDGVVVSPFDYRLDERRFLVSLDNSSTLAQVPWPSCQNLALADDQPGTWSVTYTFGIPAPQLAMDAAVQLACQIFLACGGNVCKLPAGATRVTRQGITIDRGLLASWMRNPKTGFVATGLTIVDMFLATYNPQGLRRAPSVWSPDLIQPGRSVGP